MSANVGLSTPRGSGTSGYVQKNQAHLRPRDQQQPFNKELDLLQHRQRQPDKQILEHERAREVEVKVFELRDRLEEEGVDDEEIETQCEALRQKLSKASAGSSAAARGLKKHQVHEMAAAKIQESDRLRRALGISKDYEEGSHWKKQEERLRGSLSRLDDQDEDKPERSDRDSRRREDRHDTERGNSNRDYRRREERRDTERGNSNRDYRRREDSDDDERDTRSARRSRRYSRTSSQSRSRSPR